MSPLLALLACAPPDYGLVPQDAAGSLDPLDPVQDEPELAQPAALPSVQTQAGGSATEAWLVGQGRRDDFVLGPLARTPLVDFLFVVDPSSSMSRVLEPFRDGFERLAGDGAFPERSRIGVMSTTPGDLDSPRRAHPAAHNRTTARRIPGFLALVSGASIDRYRRWARPDRAARFQLDGCQPWFAPGDTNSSGVPCLVAHTQPALVTVWIEDGLLAFDQLLDKVGPSGLFRTGAAANLVIVSDTYGPGFVPSEDDFQAGFWFDELEQARPSYDDLADRLAQTTDLASFQVHAIVPGGDCGERRVVAELDSPELAAARASGGVAADICTTSDYTAVVAEILSTGARVQRPVLALSAAAGQVQQVTVDGQPVPYRLSADDQAVILEQLPERDARVQVHYRSRGSQR